MKNDLHDVACGSHVERLAYFLSSCVVFGCVIGPKTSLETVRVV